MKKQKLTMKCTYPDCKCGEQGCKGFGELKDVCEDKKLLDELLGIWGEKMKSQDHRKELILKKFKISINPQNWENDGLERYKTNDGIIPEHFGG